MLYHLYETQRSLMEPFTDFAQAASKLFSNPLSPFSQTPMAQRMAAGYDLLYRLGKDYESLPSTSTRWTWMASASPSMSALRWTSRFANCAALSAFRTTPPR